jgi:Holliday junction DNA helicase RuvA
VSMDQFSNAIEQQDVSLLIKIPGIGRKTAERLIVELKDKQDLRLQQSSQHSKNLTDIMDALEALGYSKSDIQKVTKNFNEETNVNEGIKQALQWLSS